MIHSCLIGMPVVVAGDGPHAGRRGVVNDVYRIDGRLMVKVKVGALALAFKPDPAEPLLPQLRGKLRTIVTDCWLDDPIDVELRHLAHAGGATAEGCDIFAAVA